MPKYSNVHIAEDAILWVWANVFRKRLDHIHSDDELTPEMHHQLNCLTDAMRKKLAEYDTGTT